MTKQDKNEALEHIEDKELKITVAKVLDKAMRFEKTDKVEYTHFLDLYETRKCEALLHHFHIPYVRYQPCEDGDKSILLFIPSYILDPNTWIQQVVSCIKMIPKQKGILQHKDYMGSLYHLGIKREYIGDIIAKEACAYVFVMTSQVDFLLQQLGKVGRQEVVLQIIPLQSPEVINLEVSYLLKEIIVPSLRIDAVLSQVFPGSRNEMKKKILQGDLFVNCKNCISSAQLVQEGDVVSLKSCGKIKIGMCIRKTRSENLVLQIKKYN